jgi:hypothetical protein
MSMEDENKQCELTDMEEERIKKGKFETCKSIHEIIFQFQH